MTMRANLFSLSEAEARAQITDFQEARLWLDERKREAELFPYSSGDNPMLERFRQTLNRGNIAVVTVCTQVKKV